MFLRGKCQQLVDFFFVRSFNTDLRAVKASCDRSWGEGGGVAREGECTKQAEERDDGDNAEGHLHLVRVRARARARVRVRVGLGLGLRLGLGLGLGLC